MSIGYRRYLLLRYKDTSVDNTLKNLVSYDSKEIQFDFRLEEEEEQNERFLQDPVDIEYIPVSSDEYLE